MVDGNYEVAVGFAAGCIPLCTAVTTVCEDSRMIRKLQNPKMSILFSLNSKMPWSLATRVVFSL